MSKIEKNETYPPGDVNHRALTFGYPEGRLPSRMQCGPLTFEVPKLTGGKS
jgi:hypothetical protein